jgi:hypothetical protein
MVHKVHIGLLPKDSSLKLMRKAGQVTRGDREWRKIPSLKQLWEYMKQPSRYEVGILYETYEGLNVPVGLSEALRK